MFFNELFFLGISLVCILIFVIAKGILFDQWYKDWENITLAGAGLYGITILFRLFSRKKSTSGRKGRNSH